MKELNANTPAEYMVLNHDHTYITTEGIALSSYSKIIHNKFMEKDLLFM